jgi:hypothetical protein
MSDPSHYPSNILVKDDLICMICTNISSDPHYITHCLGTSVYGRLCVYQWVGSNSNCPHCRITTSVERCAPISNDWLQRKINTLDVTCIHKEEGCTFTGTYGRLHDHVEECGYVEVECCNACAGCNILIQRR